MTILEDNRKIKILVLNDGKQIPGNPYRDIIPYYENGQMAAVIWFDIRKNDNTEQRVNSAYVRQVVYE